MQWHVREYARPKSRAAPARGVWSRAARAHDIWDRESPPRPRRDQRENRDRLRLRQPPGPRPAPTRVFRSAECSAASSADAAWLRMPTHFVLRAAYAFETASRNTNSCHHLQRDGPIAQESFFSFLFNMLRYPSRHSTSHCPVGLLAFHQSSFSRRIFAFLTFLTCIQRRGILRASIRLQLRFLPAGYVSQGKSQRGARGFAAVSSVQQRLRLSCIFAPRYQPGVDVAYARRAECARASDDHNGSRRTPAHGVLRLRGPFPFVQVLGWGVKASNNDRLAQKPDYRQLAAIGKLHTTGA